MIDSADCAGKHNYAEASIYSRLGKSRVKTKTGAHFTMGRSEVASFCGNPAEKCAEAAQFYTSLTILDALYESVPTAGLYTMG